MPTRKRRNRQLPPLDVEFTLGAWGPKGSVLAEVEGQQVRIDRGIPGERVQTVINRRREPWRGVVTTIIEADASRIEPECQYYAAGCGGCQWQHLDYAAQLATKRTLADGELAAAGVEHRVDAVHGMDFPWRYRRTAAIAIGWEAGFRRRGRRGIIEIHDCPISHPLIGRLAAQVNCLLRGGDLPNYHGKVWLDTTVVGSDDEPALQVLLQGIPGLTPETHPELPDVARRLAGLDGVLTVGYRHHDGQARALVGPLLASIHVGGLPLLLPAGAFFQTNTRMLEQVLARMRDILMGRRIRQAADVYGGVGTFAFGLHDLVEEMILIELDPQAVLAARETADLLAIDNVRGIQSHAERYLPNLPALDVAILDPPRSGLGEAVVDALVQNPVPMLLYVSCAPASLARDLAALLARGYQVESLELYDFYPQTYHVESLTVLTRCP